MPITHAMHSILYEGRSPKEAVIRLMTRRSRPERDDHHQEVEAKKADGEGSGDGGEA